MNGTRYDGILFSKLDCLDGKKKTITIFNDSDKICTTERKFNDEGVYHTNAGVTITKEDYEMIKELNKGEFPYDIDMYSKEAFERLLHEYKTEKAIGYIDSKEVSSEGYQLVHIYEYDRNLSDYEKDDIIQASFDKTYCLFGVNRFFEPIYGEYVDNKCVFPNNLTFDDLDGAILEGSAKEHITISYK